MKHYILDAFNIIHKDPELKRKLDQSVDLASNALLNLIKDFHDKYPAYTVSVVFDGHPAVFGASTEKIRIINSGPKKTADSIIKSMISRTTTPSLTIVASSDMEIYKYARVYSCKALHSEEFLKELYSVISVDKKSGDDGNLSEKPKGISEEELSEMQLLFADESDLENLRKFAKKKSKEIDNFKITKEQINQIEKKEKPVKEKPIEPDPLAEDKPDLITRSEIEEFKKMFGEEES